MNAIVHRGITIVTLAIGAEIATNPFLRADVLLLPIENATLEEFAAWFLARLGGDREALRAHRIDAIEVRVFSGPGQSAGRRARFE